MEERRSNLKCFLCDKTAFTTDRNNGGEKFSKKFIQLLSKFLKIRSRFEEKDNSDISKKLVTCDDCFELGKSFCNLYSQWGYLRLQLEWRMREVFDVIKNTGESSLGREEKCVDGFYSEVKNLRGEILKGCERKLNSSFPKILLQKTPKEEVKEEVVENISIKCEALYTTSFSDSDNLYFMIGWLMSFVDVFNLSIPFDSKKSSNTDHRPQQETRYLGIEKQGKLKRKEALSDITVGPNCDSYEDGDGDDNNSVNLFHLAAINVTDFQSQDNNPRIINQNGHENFEVGNTTIRTKAESSHQNAAHNSKSRMCSYCSKAFSNGKKLACHIGRVHNVQLAGNSRSTKTDFRKRPVATGSTSSTKKAKLMSSASIKSKESKSKTPGEELPKLSCPFCMRPYKFQSSLNNHKRKCCDNKKYYDILRRKELDGSICPSEERSLLCITYRTLVDPVSKEKIDLSHDTKFPCPFCLRSWARRYVLKQHLKKDCNKKNKYDTKLMKKVSKLNDYHR